LAASDLKRNVLLYNGGRLAGDVVLGSAGEGGFLSRGEPEIGLSTVWVSAGARKFLFAGTGAAPTAANIERTRRAADLGYHAALVKTPHYYKPHYTHEALVEHFSRVADVAPIPVILYSVPKFTGITLEAREVAALSAHPNIIGIKD